MISAARENETRTWHDSLLRKKESEKRENGKQYKKSP